MTMIQVKLKTSMGGWFRKTFVINCIAYYLCRVRFSGQNLLSEFPDQKFIGQTKQNQIGQFVKVFIRPT